MIWRVFWKTSDSQSFGGFVRANTRTGAIRIAGQKLQKGTVICGCVEAYSHQITPQSITLNFPNETDYQFFG